MAWCGPEFERVAAALGGIDCAGVAPVVSVRSPLGLDNWTMPVLELLMIVGALAALGHAIRSWRQGDPTGIGLWVATVLQVLILEPPLYFPDRFGLQDRVGLIFVHNEFSVQFLHDRLPLYIVALYPALTYLAYALVRRIGVLERSPAVVWAAAVALVFHCLYEIFDNLGPQLHWWAWNPDAPTNSPWLGSVPLTSVVMFAAASPFGLALATRVLITRPAGPLPVWSLGLRTLAVALSGILAMLVFALPYGLWEEGARARSAVLWAELALLAGVAVWGYWSSRRSSVEKDWADWYPAGAGIVYLVTFAVFWAASLPAYLDAEGGRTSSGAPIGNLAYVLGCSVVAIAVVLLASQRAAVTGVDPVHHVGRIHPDDR